MYRCTYADNGRHDVESKHNRFCGTRERTKQCTAKIRTPSGMESHEQHTSTRVLTSNKNTFPVWWILCSAHCAPRRGRHASPGGGPGTVGCSSCPRVWCRCAQISGPRRRKVISRITTKDIYKRQGGLCSRRLDGICFQAVGVNLRRFLRRIINAIFDLTLFEVMQAQRHEQSMSPYSELPF